MNLLKQLKRLGAVVAIASAITLVAPVAIPANATMATVSAATIKLSKKKMSMLTGESKKLKVTGSKETVKWSTADKDVATVNKTGKVTAVGTGVTTITATVGKKNLTCEVSVSAFKATEQTFPSGAGFYIPEGWLLINIPAANAERNLITASETSQSFIQMNVVPTGGLSDEDFVAYIKEQATSETMEAGVEAYIQQVGGSALDLTTEVYAQDEATIGDKAAVWTYSELYYEGEIAVQAYCYDISDGAYIYEIVCYNFLESDVNFVDYVDYMAQNVTYIQ